MANTILSGLIATMRNVFRIQNVTLDASGATFPRTHILQDLSGVTALAQSLLPVLGVTPSTDQNDYNPSGFANYGILRVNASASIKITGLATGAIGRLVTIWNASTDFLLWLEHENTSSTAANRFTLPKGFPAFLMPGDTITLLYDATASRWVVWHWPNQGQAMGLPYFSDFIGDGNTLGANATNMFGAFTGVTAGTGTAAGASTYLINTTEKPAGVIELRTGSTATGRGWLGSISTAGDIVPAQGPALSVARIAVQTTVDATNTFQVFSGFIDAQGGTPTDGACWNNRWTGAAAEWSQDRYAAATATRSNTGSPTPDNNYLWLIVFLNAAWTRADFIYSTDSLTFTKAASPTTGLPSSTQLTAWCGAAIVKSVGTTSRLVSIDLAGYRVDLTRG